MSDLKRTCRRCRITQDDGHIMHELDTGRRGRHRRKQPKISKDALAAHLAVDLAKRHRHPKRRSATRIGHRTVRAVCNRLIPASRRRFDAVARQKAHLICTKCTSCGSTIAASAMAVATASAVSSICTPRPSSSGRKSRVLGNPDAKAFPGNAVGLAPNDVAAREDGDMRTKHTFRTTGHHKRDPLVDAVRND